MLWLFKVLYTTLFDLKSKNNEKIMVLIPLILVASIAVFAYLLSLQQIYAQVSSTTSPTNNNATEPLPVLLVHGYLADASTWKKWEDLLKKRQYSSVPNNI